MDPNCKWPISETDLYLSGDDVHIWCATLNPPDSCVEQIAQTLSADELKRAERFHFLEHRKQFITAHGLMRKLLANYLHIEASEIVFDYGANGKPFLSEKFTKEKIRLNLSHSNGYALMAFAYDREIGVDIEYIRDFADIYMVAKQVFSTKDYDILQSFTEIERKKAFFKIWTRKEAYLKAKGEGFSSALTNIDISFYTNDNSTSIRLGGNSEAKGHWTVQDLKPLPGYAAAFVIEGDEPVHHCWRISNYTFYSLDKND